MPHDALETTDRRSIAIMDRLASSEGSASLYILWGFFALASASAAIAIYFSPGADRRIATAMSTTGPGSARIATPIQQRREPAEAQAADTELALRIKSLEEQLGTITGSLPAKAPAAVPAPERGVTPSAALPALPATPAPAAEPAKPVRTTVIDLSGEAAEDSSLTRTMFGIDLGAEASLGAVRIRWDNLRKHYPELAGLSPRILLRDNAGKIELRLMAGPFENAADAARACAGLLARGAFCDGGLFEGQRLSAT